MTSRSFLSVFFPPYFRPKVAWLAGVIPAVENSIFFFFLILSQHVSRKLENVVFRNFRAFHWKVYLCLISYCWKHGHKDFRIFLSTIFFSKFNHINIISLIRTGQDPSVEISRILNFIHKCMYIARAFICLIHVLYICTHLIHACSLFHA